MVSRTLTVKLLNLVHSVGVPIPVRTARGCRFLAGSFVRVIVLDDEIRIRHVAAPRAYDLETIDEYRERMMVQDRSEES